jgi:hypothetical protein
MKRTKEALIARLQDALGNLYHNATPQHPHAPDALGDDYWQWFNDAARYEIEYISDGLGNSCAEYAKERRKGWPHKGERNAWLVSRITDYGKLHTWGRGGRTLAPDKLVRQRGGSSFSIANAEDYSEHSNAGLVEMIEVIEAFNAYIVSWCSRENLEYMWREECRIRRDDVSFEAKKVRKALRRLAADSRALAGIAGDAACGALKGAIAAARREHKALVISIGHYNEALGA